MEVTFNLTKTIDVEFPIFREIKEEGNHQFQRDIMLNGVIWQCTVHLYGMSVYIRNQSIYIEDNQDLDLFLGLGDYYSNEYRFNEALAEAKKRISELT